MSSAAAIIAIVVIAVKFEPITTGTSAGFWLGGQCPLPPDAKKILKI